MATALVTGTNKGIGLELCRRLRDRGDGVIAACRRSSPELEALDVEILAGIDVTDDPSMGRLRDEVGSRRIDTLIHNAGWLSVESLEDLDFDRIRKQFEVNTLGPLRVTAALLPNLARGSKVAIVTSLMGSMGDNGSGGYYGYRISKAGVNMVAVNLAHDLRSRGIAIAVLHPGLVATDMTEGMGVAPAEAARGLIERIDDLTLGNSGGFWHAEGRKLPW